MRRSLVSAVLAGLLLGASPGDLPPSTHTEDLLDAPGGHPVAILLPGTPRRVLEAKEGFVKVVVEGWIRQEGPAPKTDALPAVADPLPPSSPAAPEVAPVASISGRVEIRLPTKEVRYGAGARVMLLGKVTELEPRRVGLASAYQAEVRELQAQITELEAAKKKALNSSDNLTQATKNLDQAKASLARKTQDLEAIGKKYATQGEALAESFKVAEVTADPGGEYHLDGVAAGEYRLRAWFSDQGSEYRWYVPASVTARERTVVDLSAAKPGPDPFLQVP